MQMAQFKSEKFYHTSFHSAFIICVYIYIEFDLKFDVNN